MKSREDKEARIMGAVVVILAIAIGILILGAKACSGADWTWRRGDTIRQIAFTAVTLTDMSQTVRIATEKNQGQFCWKEYNPILGEHPTEHQVYAYFVSSIVLNALIARALPHKYREAFQYLSIGFSGAYVVMNFNEGIKP